jgi:putative endonuclease
LSGRSRCPCVYLLASGRHGTLYVGVTSDVVRRVWEHRNGMTDGFTRKYGVKRLVYLEVHATMLEAITREKQMKKWERAWKIALIERDNPRWRDLYEDIAGSEPAMDSRLRGNDGK